jgi:hypothetical protein
MRRKTLGCCENFAGRRVRCALLALTYWVLLTIAGITDSVAAATEREQPRGTVILEVFVREGCPHCAAAEEFLPGFAAERPWLRLVYRHVDRDPAARAALIRVSEAAGLWPPGVPTFALRGRAMVGFGSAEESGAALAAFVDDAAKASDAIETRLFGTLSASRLGLPLFTLAIGLLDGFNPCAMWLLLFLLSLLVHLRDRRRMALVAGTFVLVSGAVYYVFMAAWLNLFLAVGMSAALRWLLAAIALAIGAINLRDGLRRDAGFVLSIPDAAKPGLYARMRRVLQARSLMPALLGVAVLAVVVNFVEILCTAGFPALYTAVLAQHELSPASNYAYLALYIFGYILDDSIMVAVAVIALGARKLTPRAGQALKLVSGAVMLLLGAVLLLRPAWLM